MRIVVSLGLLFASLAALAQNSPTYKVDPFWPKQLPNDWIIGQIGGLTVDRQNHIWVLQRPGSDTPDELGAAQKPPRSQCCFAAPPVLEFDQQGNLLRSWGGPGNGYDWPGNEHGIRVDNEGNVWIAANGPKDRQVLKFTGDGRFLLQIGHPDAAPVPPTASAIPIFTVRLASTWTTLPTRSIFPTDIATSASWSSIPRPGPSSVCGVLMATLPAMPIPAPTHPPHLWISSSAIPSIACTCRTTDWSTSAIA